MTSNNQNQGQDQRQIEARRARDVRHGADLTHKIGAWSRQEYAQFRAQHAKVREIEAKGCERVEGWAAGMREMAGLLHSGGQAKALDDVKPENAWMGKVLEHLDELPEWQRLKQRCKGDGYGAGSAAAGLASKVVEQVPAQQDDADEARRIYDLIAEDFENGMATDDRLQQAKARLDAAIADAQDAAAKIDPAALRHAARQAVQQANQDLDDMDRTCRAMGWDGKGTASSQAMETKAALARLLSDNKKLAEIMKVAGRMRNILNAVRATKVKRGASELSDVETGADIGRLLPAELGQLTDPTLEGGVMRRLLERGCLQYKLEAKEKVQQGPIVVCVDDSGSMDGPREIWAKGLALAMMELARREKRAFAYCAFDTRLVASVSEQVAKRQDPAEILATLAMHSGGGTSFDVPMKWALEQIAGTGNLEHADVILVSDGECYAHDAKAIKAKLAATGARTWGIAVSASAINCTGKGSMRDLCEEVYPISEVGQDPEGERRALHGVMSV